MYNVSPVNSSGVLQDLMPLDVLGEKYIRFYVVTTGTTIPEKIPMHKLHSITVVYLRHDVE